MLHRHLSPGTRTATDKDSFLTYKDHQTTKLCINTCDKCILLSKQEKLPQGWLPTTSQVLAYYLTMNKNNIKTNSLVDVCSDVMLHWVLCNVYTRVQQIAYTSTYVHQVKQVVHTIFFQRTLTDVKESSIVYTRSIMTKYL